MTRHDKHELPIWLEEELRDIDQMIGILDAVKKSAFSLSSSPVDVLVRLLVDLVLKIKNSYEHGVPKTESLNPQIIFDEMATMGPLGNSPQRTIEYHSNLNWEPVYNDRESSPMPRFLKGIAVFFSRSLEPSFDFQKSFHGFLKGLAEFLPPGFTSQKSNHAEKTKQDIKQIRVKKARNAYYRRRRQRQ